MRVSKYHISSLGVHVGDNGGTVFAMSAGLQLSDFIRQFSSLKVSVHGYMPVLHHRSTAALCLQAEAHPHAVHST